MHKTYVFQKKDNYDIFALKLLLKYSNMSKFNANIFTKIYNAARIEDILLLCKIVSTGISVNIIEGEHTPISLLASQGRRHSVDVLINDFGGDVRDAVWGYAVGGYETLANLHINNESDTKKRTKLIRRAIAGYAFRGDVNKLNDLLKQISLAEQNKLNKMIVFFYALGGHKPLVEQAFKSVNQADELLLKNYAVLGYASGNFTTEVDAIIATAGRKKNELKMMAVRGYARGAHMDAIENIIKEDISKRDFIKTMIIPQLALNGYPELVDKELQLLPQRLFNKIICQVVSNYALSGHVNEAKKLIIKYHPMSNQLKKAALKGYAKADNIKEIEALITDEEDSENKFEFTKVVLQVYAHMREVERLAYFINQLQNFHDKTKIVTLIEFAENLHYKLMLKLLAAIENDAIKQLVMERLVVLYANQAPEVLVELLAHVDDDDEREALVHQAWRCNESVNTQSLYTETTDLNHKMKTHYLDSIDQAKVLAIPGIRTWLLQGVNLVRVGVIPYEIYMEITLKLTGLTLRETENLIIGVYKCLYEDVQEQITMRWYNRLRLFPIRVLQLAAAEEQHQYRQAFIPNR